MATHSQSPHPIKAGCPHSLAGRSHPRLEEPLWGPPAVTAHHHEAHTSGVSLQKQGNLIKQARDDQPTPVLKLINHSGKSYKQKGFLMYGESSA